MSQARAAASSLGRPSRTERFMNKDVVASRVRLVAPLLALLSGCVGLDTNPLCSSAPPPAGTPCQVVALWQPQGDYPPDPTHAGVPSPTLAAPRARYGPEPDVPRTR